MNRVRGIAARFRVRAQRELEPQIPLYNVGPPLADDDDEDKLGLVNNNPSEDEVLYNDDSVNDGSPLTALLTLDESDEESDESVGDNNKEEASSTDLSHTADGSSATTTSPTALDRLVDESDAPPASTTVLDSSVDDSAATREGEAAAAGAVSNDDTPVGNDAMGDSSIPPMRQSTCEIRAANNNGCIGAKWVDHFDRG